MWEQPSLIWWTAIPLTKRTIAGAEQLVSVPFKNWQELINHCSPYYSCGGADVTFYGEDNAGSGLIASKARITTYGGILHVIIGNESYRLPIDKMISKLKLKKTETIPPEILYTIKLKGINKSEDNLLVVTEKDAPDSPVDSAPTRNFYWLTREPNP